MARFSKFLLLFLAAILPASAANHFIRAGATGATCADWGTNACNDLPATLTRGDTYYMAAGSYATHEFDDLESGTSVITIKAATVADHGGVSTGWLDSYAAGGVTPAKFTGRVNIWRGYYTFDGQSSTNIKTGHGLLVDITAFPAAQLNPPCQTYGDCYGITFATGNAQHNNILRYVEVKSTGPPIGGCNRWNNGAQPASNPCPRGDSMGIYGDAGAAAFDGFLFQHISVHDFPDGGGAGGAGSGQIQTIGWTNWTIENSYFARNISSTGTGGGHSEGWSNDGGSYITWRYNVFEDVDGTGVLVSQMSGGTADNVNIYGNVVYTSNGNPYGNTVGNGVFVCLSPGACTNWHVYNNTIVNMTATGGAGVSISAAGPNSVTVENNIWYNCTNADMIGTVPDYNSFLNTTKSNEAGTHSVQNGSAPNPFVSWTTGNFRLASDNALWNAWHALLTPYNVDPDGVTRTSSRGAYQYVSGVVAPTVTTTSATSITTTTASSGGNVTSDGGCTPSPSCVTARGVCYAITANPTVPCTSNGTGVGVFTSSLTGLIPGTLYHYRAYATNSAGTAYGSDLTFTAVSIVSGSAIFGAVTYAGVRQ